MSHKVAKSEHFSNISKESESPINSFSNGVYLLMLLEPFSNEWMRGEGGAPPPSCILQKCALITEFLIFGSHRNSQSQFVR